MVRATEGASENPDGVVELDADDLIEVDEDRAGLLTAAHGARDVSMLTGTHGVVAPPLQRPRARLPEPDEIHPGAVASSEAEEVGRLRALVSTRAGDSVGELRARLELARAEVERGYDEGARKEATIAAQVNDASPAAHAMLRALLVGRSEVNEQLHHVDRLVSAATRPSTRADWLCERARLLEARDGVTAESIGVWKEALALAPEHVGALYGIEVALDKGKRHAELADMLGELANLARDREHSAWLLVERAILLDRHSGDHAAARGALTRALELSPGLGPVRSACVDYAVRHRDDAALAELLEAEARLEPDRLRAARLELDAALAGLRSGAPREAVLGVLERAFAREPTTPFLDSRVADELARLYDEANRQADALNARKAALRSITEPREQVVALRMIAMSAERAGVTDDAVLALERAMMLDGDDETHLEELDRVLLEAARHEARAVLWLREAARLEDPTKKARALLISADASRAAGNEEDAKAQREAAWLTAPTAPGVFDALVAEIRPVAPNAELLERIALYERSVRSTSDPDRKIHLLEKLAWLKDDVAGDTAAAIADYEAILAIEPGRLSAILGLGSVATRAGDARALAKALAAQADVTIDLSTRAALRLQSAEALATVDPERALALAEELRGDATIRQRADQVVTRLHILAERWEPAARVLAERAQRASERQQKIGFVLAETTVLLGRLHAPARALEALARLPKDAVDDPGVRAAMIDALEALGDDNRLREELLAMAERATVPHARARLFLRAAELEELRGADDAAVRAYESAHAAMPVEPLIDERIRRIGARVALPPASAAMVSQLQTAMRAIDLIDTGSAEPLMATGARDIATLRLAERIARRAGSAPQLANALVLTAAAHPHGLLAVRAYEGLASLVTWTLPVSDDDEAWLRLLTLGSTDVVVLDTLVRRARHRVQAHDESALGACIAALMRRCDSAADDTEHLMLRLDLTRLRRRAGQVPEAGGEAKRALALDPTSLSAACLLSEIAAELDDDEAAIVASRALAAIVSKPETKAELLRDAGDLATARGERDLAAQLFGEALRADPENVQIAARLAAHQRSRRAFGELARALSDALDRAKNPEAIVPMASELADVARNELKDPLLAISALERLRVAVPTHVPTLFLLSELFIGQRAWDKALVALAGACDASHEKNNKLVALSGRASIYRRVLGQPKAAEAELRKALALDDFDTRTIRNLLDLGSGINPEERAMLLTRFVGGEIPPLDRMRALLELAEARRAISDDEGAESALVEAASFSPEPWMFEHVRTAVSNNNEAFARVLSKAVMRAHEQGRSIDPSWLVGLGVVELDLDRLEDAIDRFEEALRADPTRDDARVYLARALSALGRHAPAAIALTTVLASPTRRVAADVDLLRGLEGALAGSTRTNEQWVVREIRGIAGDLSTEEQSDLDHYLAAAGRHEYEGVSSAFLRSSLMPHGFGRQPLWDVATITAGFANKMTRLGLSEQGSSTRERVKPRTPHPMRPLFDRMLRAFGLEEVELAVSENLVVPAVACEDVPWVIVPAGLANAPDAYAIASLARPLTRIALGVPWFGALPSTEVAAMLVGTARLVAPGFAARPPERIEPNVEDYLTRARKAIDRKRRRALEELEPILSSTPPFDEPAFAESVIAAETRAAFLLSGSFRAALDAYAVSDPPLLDALRVQSADTLEIVFGRNGSRDLAAFALSSDATSLRRGISRM
ncbi:MAG: tetratricopeptide repeat protein [Labilithrix sp.]